MSTTRKIILPILLALAVVGAAACDKPVAMQPCRTVFPMGDVHPLPPPNVHYDGATDTWISDEGIIFGYAVEEDSLIWNTLACARYDAARQQTNIIDAVSVERRA